MYCELIGACDCGKGRFARWLGAGADCNLLSRRARAPNEISDDVAPSQIACQSRADSGHGSGIGRSEAMVTLTAYVQAYAENGLSVYGVDVRSCHSGYSQDFPAPSF
jgi:hypothetical protein